MPVILLSDLFQQNTIHLFETQYFVAQPASLHDTIRIAFDLVNDMGADTSILYFEGLNEWFQFVATPLTDDLPAIKKISGRNYYAEIPYEYIYFPAQTIRIDSGARYRCQIKLKGFTYSEASSNVWLVTDKAYHKELVYSKNYAETNFVLTYIFLGAIGFGFFFFFFLYFKSRYAQFGLYALFLFIHALYGFIQIDVYTKLGHFLLFHYNWDDYVNEVLVFAGQAVYVQFLIFWLNIKSGYQTIYKIFNGISIFFLTYAVFFLVLYKIDSHSIFLEDMETGIRLISIVFQLIVLYLLVFKIKSDVKSYVITGTLLMVFFGIIMVYLEMQDFFEGTLLNNFDNGSLYMIGILSESMCFALGLGLRYFHITEENILLHEENVNVLQSKLMSEKEARENERKLAEVNQELTNQQLTALRAQMNPHFIFNALNSIQKYILTGSVDEANSYLSKFSKLQRMILSYCDENFITLDKEINMLQLYLEIEQLRLTDDFTFMITVDDDIEPEEILIPPMMLQPFAENAIWHGLVPKEGEKRLNIKFIMSNADVLTCIVEDNGVGRTAAAINKAGKLMDSTINKSKGLSLVYNRLTILEKKYGKEFSVEIRDKVDADQHALGTVVELSIPLAD